MNDIHHSIKSLVKSFRYKRFHERSSLCRLPLLFLVPGLFAIVQVVPVAAEETSVTVYSNEAERLIIPPLIKIGSVGDRVRELQATLNQNLQGQIIALPKGSQIGPVAGPQGTDIKHSVRKLVLSDGRDLRIKSDWRPCDVHGNIINGELSASDPEETKYLSLPPENPLRVDGVYGQHTYAGVLLFQLQMNLQPTGQVDAVTLDKLEPMIPSNFVLAGIMKWLKAIDFFSSENDQYALWIKRGTAIISTLLLLLTSAILHRFARSLVSTPRFLDRWLFTESSSPWFMVLRENRVFLRMAHFVPAAFIFIAARILFPEPLPYEEDPFPYLDTFQNCYIYVSRFGLAYAAFTLMLFVLAFVDSYDCIYTADQPPDNPIEGIIRTTKRLVTLVGVVLICAAVTGRNPMYFVGALGAFMAMIILVFKDPILGLVASIQIVANKLVKLGDRIEVPKVGADGYVLEISLSCVKVQNFDKTIIMIPTHSLLSQSFQNWSGVEAAGGRRIKRAILINIDSIKVCTDEMIQRFGKIDLISQYIQQKKKELELHNDQQRLEESVVNSRRLTNLGTFRAYLDAYLSSHTALSSELTLLVRQLQPTEFGLPLEIYGFCTDTDWANYEAVQADIFDHVLSVLPEFELRAFQGFSSSDTGRH